ncbi:MAG: bacteriophage abortive infection AbiH family protein [Defluviitaleaceae bacterium]|nr:bacteriophage abortive infection AbiH family protein [Defluviitaleaceae bacterium]
MIDLFYKTLLIIGNGFDLQCGLQTNYEHFFSWLKTSEHRNKNLWAVHFLNNMPEGQDWVNIEESLQNAINRKSWRRGHSLFGKWIDDAQEMKRSYGDYAIREENAVAHYIATHTKNPSKSLPQETTPYWFLDELIAFERLFSEFLSKQVSDNDNYIPNAAKLLDKLLDEEDKRVSIVNFNYTKPFKFSENDKYINVINSVENVHGAYDEDNIIFGIDVKSASISDARIFSKTHRKMFQQSAKSILPKIVDKIKIYGHSLGEADYSYFHSIFDFYNLYGNGNLVSLDYKKLNPPSIVLQFYFTVYDESEETVIKRNATDSVYKLIATYGKSFDNKDKGENLLHKLLLENRIKIYFLSNI